MQEIKQIILSRIRDICQLQRQFYSHDLRCQQISRKKSIQMQRNAQEHRLLISLDSYIYDYNYIFGPMLDVVFEICSSYDSNLQLQQGVDARQKLYKLLKLFFIANGYKEKVSTLKSTFMKSNFVVSPSLIFTWLSEWSRKKYLQTLNLEVKPRKQTIPYVLVHETKSIQIQKDTNDEDNEQIRYSNKSDKIGAIGQSRNNTQGALIRYSQKQIYSKRRTQNAFQSQTKPTERMKTISNIEACSNIKYLTIYNRATLYGYIYDEMIQYYKLNDIMSLDINYIKLMRKKKLKQLLLTKENEKKSIQVLIQCSNNKIIKNLIKQYCSKYNLYKVQDSSKPASKTNDNSNHKLNQSLTSAVRNKKSNFYLPIQEFRSRKNSCEDTAEQIIDEHQINNKMETIQSISNFQSIQQQVKQKINYRLKRMQIGCQSFGRKLPNINKQNQKQYRQKQVNINFQCSKLQQIQNEQQIKNHLKFKFNQRQTIKGIIMRNFLSNRQKIGKIIEESHYVDDKQQFLTIKSANKVKNSIQRIQKMEKTIQNTNIRSLRQKTNAILRNFRIIQNS